MASALIAALALSFTDKGKASPTQPVVTAQPSRSTLFPLTSGGFGFQGDAFQGEAFQGDAFQGEAFQGDGDLETAPVLGSRAPSP